MIAHMIVVLNRTVVDKTTITWTIVLHLLTNRAVILLFFVTVLLIVASKISQPMHPPACKKNPLVPTVCAQYQLHVFVFNSGWSKIIITQKH